ncbi:MAG: lysophospholipase [Bacilli bacterium]|nr:lysophospholipase [Bacilli bacterium]
MKIKKAKQMVTSKLFFIVISIVLLCLLIGSFFYFSSIMEHYKNENPYEIKVEANDNFVFLGDSITEGYPTKELFDDLPIINSGVSGYTTDDILKNLDEMVTIYNPTKVFILIGTNDIALEKSESQITNNIKKIVQNILRKRPNTKIYIESIYPINNVEEDKIDHEVVGVRNNKKIKQINKKLKRYCKEKGYTYINIYDELSDKSGNIDLKYTKEGLHLNDLGYLKVTKALYQYLK